MQTDTFPTLPKRAGGRIDNPVEPSFPGEHPVPDVDAPLHVVHSEDGWILKFEGTDEVAAVLRTKREAMDRARSIASERDLRIVEHGVDGKIM